MTPQERADIAVQAHKLLQILERDMEGTDFETQEMTIETCEKAETLAVMLGIRAVQARSGNKG